jgi:putative inorganic carbon (HCO3(-)) transporter
VLIYYVFVVSLPLISHRIFGSDVGGMTVTKYLGLASLGYALLTLGRRRGPVRLLATPQARWFVVLYSLAVLSSALGSIGPRGGNWNVLQIYNSQLIFFLTTLILVDSVDRLRKVLLVAIGSMALASLYVLREWWGGSAVYGVDYRPGYVTGDPNFFAASAVVCLPMAFVWTLEGTRPWERMYCLGCLAVGLAGSMVAASRGGFVGLLVGLAVLTWHSRYRVKALTIVGGVLVMALVISPTSPLKRLLDPSHGDIGARDARIQLWTAGLKMVEAHPLLGVGIGNFRMAAADYGGMVGDITFIAHNGYLDVAAELGLPALLALLAVIFFSCRAASKVRRQTRVTGQLALHQAAWGIEAGLFGFAVALFFVSGLFLKLFWLMVFLSMCLASLRAATQAEKQPRVAA